MNYKTIPNEYRYDKLTQIILNGKVDNGDWFDTHGDTDGSDEFLLPSSQSSMDTSIATSSMKLSSISKSSTSGDFSQGT